MRKRTYLTVTDQFCGAGGSSLGAVKAGLEVRMALNHWKLAIETHNTNFPDTDHDCTDVSASDPRRYPRTDVLITSPECTTHSPAGGGRRYKPQSDLFEARLHDPSLARSRATMWDVPRFAEFHEYEAVVVENVLEVTRWVLFPEWLAAMTKLGYEHRILSINSMFCHPTPQSRDRIYIVFWRKGNRAPRLDLSPAGPCPQCERNVETVQAWKNGRSLGKYRQQYEYRCPTCRSIVRPYYYAALNAIDFSIPAERIRDRARPLKPRTLERIRYGLEKFGRSPLVVRTNMTSGIGCRVRSAADPLDTQPASNITALVSPFLVNGHAGRRTYGATDPMSAQVASCVHDWLTIPPAFTVETAYSNAGHRTRTVDRELAAQTTAQSMGLAIPPAFVATLRGNSRAHSAGDPLTTMTAQAGHHMLVAPAALVNLRDWRRAETLCGPVSDPTPAQVCATQTGIASLAPFLIQYYGQGKASGVDDAVPAVTAIDRHGVVQPETPDVEDCYFRMLQPHEVGAAMAFPDTYVVLGNKRERVRQYGNAVTPPVMDWIIRQLAESLS